MILTFRVTTTGTKFHTEDGLIEKYNELPFLGDIINDWIEGEWISTSHGDLQTQETVIMVKSIA